MVTDIKVNKKNNQNKTQNRRSRKKRRTEISSSEEDSSSSSSDDDDDDNDDQHDKEEEKVDKIEDDDIEMKDIEEDKSNIGIDNLEIVNGNINDYNKDNYAKTDKDITQTRLKLRQIDDMNLIVNSKTFNNNNKNDEHDASGISSDEWLKLMLSEYGDDIETLRTKAADFRGESISILAEMLRSTKDIFKEI